MLHLRSTHLTRPPSTHTRHKTPLKQITENPHILRSQHIVWNFLQCIHGVWLTPKLPHINRPTENPHISSRVRIILEATHIQHPYLSSWTKTGKENPTLSDIPHRPFYSLYINSTCNSHLSQFTRHLLSDSSNPSKSTPRPGSGGPW